MEYAKFAWLSVPRTNCEAKTQPSTRLASRLLHELKTLSLLQAAWHPPSPQGAAFLHLPTIPKAAQRAVEPSCLQVLICM